MMSKISCALITNGLAVVHSGHLNPCCNWSNPKIFMVKWTDYPNYNEVVRRPLVEMMERGEFPDPCKKCEWEEKINVKSLRMMANEWYGDRASAGANQTNPIYDIEMKFGNYCNLRCIMCGPYASTSWLHEIKQNYAQFLPIHDTQPLVDIGEEFPWYEDPKFYDFLREILSNVSRINISGGEPLLYPRTLDVLDILIEAGRTDVWLQCSTNLTRLPERFVDKLQKFSNVRLAVSLEGVGEHNDYLRYGSRFKDIADNVDHLIGRLGTKSLGAVHHVLQHTSVYTLPGLAKFCHDRNIPITFTAVQIHDNALKIDGAPPRDLARLVEWAESCGWLDQSVRQAVLGLKDIKFNPVNHAKFRQYMAVLDSVRGTSYDQLFQPSTV